MSIQDRVRVRDGIAYRAGQSPGSDESYFAGAALRRTIRNGVAITALVWMIVALSVLLYVQA